MREGNWKTKETFSRILAMSVYSAQTSLMWENVSGYMVIEYILVLSLKVIQTVPDFQ